MKQRYRIAATITMVFHWVWAALLLIGIPIQLAVPGYRPFHLAAVTVTILSQLLWLGCPLMALENAFRSKYDSRATYTGSFLCHYLRKWLGIRVPPWVFTVQLAGLWVAALIFYSHKV
jgi:hypothetical protein